MVVKKITDSAGCNARSALERAPGAAVEQLERAEAGLVGHLGAARDPVAEIDVGQGFEPHALDQPEDRVGAEAAPARGRLVEAVDRRAAVIDLVDQTGAEQLAVAAELDEPRVDGAVL